LQKLTQEELTLKKLGLGRLGGAMARSPDRANPAFIVAPMRPGSLRQPRSEARHG
jgi:hypothetical protein